jgi:hypothetical protein
VQASLPFSVSAMADALLTFDHPASGWQVHFLLPFFFFFFIFSSLFGKMGVTCEKL